MTESEPSIDLDAYCRRIGYSGPRRPSLAVLRGVVERHTRSIPFENLDPLLGRIPRLDIASIEAKLVRGRRGGYCFEHNTLLQHALRALGFATRALGARVLLNQPDDIVPSRTHMLLEVTIEGATYLADVGFGGMTPTGPLLFQPGSKQATPHETYRIDEAGPEFELSAEVGDHWTRLYRFHFIEHVAIDHEVNNYFVASRPESFFRNAIVAAIAAPEGRHLLFNDRLTFQRIDGTRDERRLHGVAATLTALDEIFEIDVPDTEAFAAAFARLGSG